MSNSLTPVERRKAIQRILLVDDDGVFGAATRAAFQALATAQPAAVSSEGQGNGDKGINSSSAENSSVPIPLSTSDPRSEGNIATLNPAVQPLARELIKSFNATYHGLGDAHVEAKVISGTRSYEEQAILRNRYLAGGPKAAPAGWSNHNFGLAFDIGIFVDNVYIDDAQGMKAATIERLYGEAAAIGKALGLFAGNDWTGRDQDPPHFELRPKWAAQMNESAMLTELRRRKDQRIDPLA